MKLGLSLLALAYSIASVSGYTASAVLDKVDKLPGSPEVTFNQFSGYVGVGGNKQMFYNFVEAAENPEDAPLLLWTNGGPGCSGLLALFTEQGPFRPTEDGELKMNPYAWNKFANVVFIEQPVGVGFSYTGGDDVDYGDDQAAADNYQFILGFFEKFPEYNKHDFYITSESYGGHYMPTLAQAIVKNGGVENFKGLAVGNPITWMPYRNYGQLATFAGHQTVPKPLWDRFLAIGCDKVTTPDYHGECKTIADKISDLNAGFDPYALDFPVCQEDSMSSGREERFTFLSHVMKAQALSTESVSFRGVGSLEVKYHDNDPSYFPRDYQPCEQDFTVDYLNRADVQKAMHINMDALGEDFEWGGCAGIDYSIEDVNQPMMPVWEFLTSSGAGLKLMIYSGDDDSICATAGTQQFIWNMGWDVVDEWSPWNVVEEQIGGYHVKFNNPRDAKGTGSLHFATVHGAGHMVPSTRPEQASELMKRFLNDKL